MQQRNPIILMGMKHCGKTTLGRRLAERRGSAFLDLDTLLLQITDEPSFSSAREVFRARGEAAFRSLEAEAAAELARILAADPDCVAALGGGTVANSPAMRALEGAGLFVYIDESPEVLFERIRRGGLPPFLSERDPYADFLRLFNERAEGYRSRADLIITLRGQNPQQAVELLEEHLKEHANGR